MLVRHQRVPYNMAALSEQHVTLLGVVSSPQTRELEPDKPNLTREETQVKNVAHR